MDSGWKYMYDKYNDVFRWVPLNGDHAGLYARVDRERETWVSAAGSSKGKIKNVVKLAWSPDQTQRDALYINDVNPVTILPVAGPVMYGDKTLLGIESAFSRINVRRLFIILEKTIATAANSLLFEFNDEFTQRRFVSIVEPFLRNVKGRRGITDFKVVADNRVNTPEVIQANRFVGQVFVKPNYSINFIRLDFVAVGNSASFDEVIGSI
jgi:phage tail sheath protein FI